MSRFNKNRGPHTFERIGLFTLLLVGAVFAATTAMAGGDGKSDFELTILHNNDGESQLIDAGGSLEDFGGVARFATLVHNLRHGWSPDGSSADLQYGKSSGPANVLMLSSGDNFLAGPEFTASLEKGVPFYDSMALDWIRYDAMAIGNHEFDFGPDVLADFIRGFERPFPFLSANLDVSGEPALDQLADEGRIAASTVIVKKGRRVGIIGATTQNLPFISSPRNVVVNDVAPAVQAEIDALTGAGVDIIILISHLQSISEDLELIGMLTGLDVAIGGGGDELLANEGDLLVPGDEGEIYGPYPLWVENAAGVDVPVVTTSGDYRYVGRLIVSFDGDGELVAVDETSGPVRVAGGTNPDAVKPFPAVQKNVTDPVMDYVSGLAANIVATSEVDLDGRRTSVRAMETNEGNLVADALLWQATLLAADYSVPPPDVALQNGGGIRNNNIIPAGSISELNTFEMLPFTNFITILPAIPREQFKEVLENAVSRVESGSGRFAQVSGISFEYDPTATPQELDADGNVVVAGSRIVNAWLDDGTMLVDEGSVMPGADLSVATIDFLARGGDQYPFRGAVYTTLGVTYQQALSYYLQDGLGGLVTAADYPEGGSGRITSLGGALAAHEAEAIGNYPNPFNPSTTIRFSMTAGGRATLRVFDVKGRLVKTLLDESLSAGSHTAVWDGKDSGGRTAASGMYFYRLQTDKRVATRNMLLVK